MGKYLQKAMFRDSALSTRLDLPPNCIQNQRAVGFYIFYALLWILRGMCYEFPISTCLLFNDCCHP